MDTLTLKDLAVVATPFLIFLLSAVVAVMGFLLKGLINKLDENIKTIAGQTEKVKQDLTAFMVTLPQHYVMKDDYIRAVSGLEFKLDGIGKKLDSIIGRDNDKSRV